VSDFGEQNKNSDVIKSFGKEWEKFNFIEERHDVSLKEQFSRYFALIDENWLSNNVTEAADFGAGSGRWTDQLLPKVKFIHVIEPSLEAFKILESKFSGSDKIHLHNCTIENSGIADNSLDFAMSLGVIHHIEDSQDALNKIFRTLKPAGVFLGYLYYRLDNKPYLYRLIWRLSDFIRKFISSMPFRIKSVTCDLIAILVYFPLARSSKIMNLIGLPTSNIPLHQYADLPLYMMRNDSLDRFGTSLEKRYSQPEIIQMLLKAGAKEDSIKFSDQEPFWTFVAEKSD
jgi:ubiquinone/menaquinone biosynthesis C-methylase UbiE